MSGRQIATHQELVVKVAGEEAKRWIEQLDPAPKQAEVVQW
jgi:hypothetical protein